MLSHIGVDWCILLCVVSEKTDMLLLLAKYKHFVRWDKNDQYTFIYTFMDSNITNPIISTVISANLL